MKTFEYMIFKPLAIELEDLNFFGAGDPPPQDPPPGDPPPQDPPVDPKPGDKKVEFSKEQQEELNRILSEKLKKEREKYEKDYQQKLEDAKTEAEKLAKMNAEQKAEYERQQREKAIAEREAAITKRELRAEALETLADKGLPKTLADILVFSDAEATKASLDAVEKAFRSAVEEEVNKRLKGTPPGGGGGGGNTERNPFTKEHWNLTEQAKLFTSDPKKYELLKAQANT